MTQHTFGEISDEIPTKYHLPLGANIWELFKTNGWEWLKNFFTEFGKMIYDLSTIRLNESIYTAHDIFEGKIPEWQADKTLTFAFFPVVLAIRSDLQQGAMKLLFGESSDTTFLFIHDFEDGEAMFALNLHLEDGIPVDWWVINQSDEFFDRRHMKLGYKLKNIPKRSKNLDQAAARIINTLSDARNERTPQWNSSAYSIVITWCSAGLNMVLEASSYEVLSFMFDGIASKSAYKLKDYWFNWWPAPPMVGSFGHAGSNLRQKFTEVMAGLFTEHRLYLHPIEKEAHPLINATAPECFSFMQNKWEQKGMLMPYQSYGRISPQTRDKKVYKNADQNPELLETIYPDDPDARFKLEDLGLTFEEVLEGAYLDLTLDSRKEDVTPDVIISRKHGRKTEFLWKEYTGESKARAAKRSSLRSAVDKAGIDMKSVDKIREDFQYRPKK
ncbi:MAG: hypothetical protein HWN65_23935 [Candidatus Helarchaeota archaeon]|nr:hypothetical protein [Candidatus Helarchaeota archaeon]